jgi:hypothetical protein
MSLRAFHQINVSVREAHRHSHLRRRALGDHPDREPWVEGAWRQG